VHILTAEQFNTSQIEKIFRRADYLRGQSATLAGRKKVYKLHEGRQLCSIFFQPSTRTRLSFEIAATKLGMGVISTENAREHSSSAKGETIEDTAKILDGYDVDLIVMRHYEAGAVARAAAVCKTPVINAGDGTGEHPTQALLDAYAIKQAHGRLTKLNVVIGGDLSHGRTVRSLSWLLSKYPKNHIVFVSIPELRVGSDVKKFLKASGTTFEETSDVKAALAGADVVYWTRLQAEYLKDPKAVSKGFSLNEKSIDVMKKTAILMHPLPRVDEIAPAVDADPRAAYFRQAAGGLYVRMALIDTVIQNG